MLTAILCITAFSDLQARSASDQNSKVAANSKKYVKVWDGIVNGRPLDLLNTTNFTEDVLVYADPENVAGIETMAAFYKNFIMINLMVLYPWPKDDKQFEGDYGNHLDLLHEKMGIPQEARPYTVTKFQYHAGKYPAFYQLFTLPFESQAALDSALASPAMQEVAADANRISSGGAPVILVGEVYEN